MVILTIKNQTKEQSLGGFHFWLPHCGETPDTNVGFYTTCIPSFNWSICAAVTSALLFAQTADKCGRFLTRACKRCPVLLTPAKRPAGAQCTETVETLVVVELRDERRNSQPAIKRSLKSKKKWTGRKSKGLPLTHPCSDVFIGCILPFTRVLAFIF